MKQNKRSIHKVKFTGERKMIFAFPKVLMSCQREQSESNFMISTARMEWRTFDFDRYE